MKEKLLSCLNMIESCYIYNSQSKESLLLDRYLEPHINELGKEIVSKLIDMVANNIVEIKQNVGRCMDGCLYHHAVKVNKEYDLSSFNLGEQ